MARRSSRSARPDVIPELRRHFEEFHKAHPAAATNIEEALSELLSDAGVSYDRVSCRVKSWRSLRAKAVRQELAGEPRWSYPDPWHDIHDIIGARVTTFHSTAIPTVIDVLSDALEILETEDKTTQTRVSGEFGYGSHHLIARIPTPAPPGLEGYEDSTLEVQIRTVLQHAWAEFEHDIRYKADPRKVDLDSVADARIDRAFTLAAGLIELADQQFDQIAAVLDERSPDTSISTGADDVDIVAEDLPGMLTLMLGPRFPRSRADQYPWIKQLLTANDVQTVGQLRELTTPENVADVIDATGYSFTPGHARVVDDLLLQQFGDQHIAATAELGRSAQRKNVLKSRLKQRLKSQRS
ncbi:GTP pyrophosphokinase [Corynebacterium ulceribovis]|uniref:GTP pyrophosphokinase n=1 Tax=Corynebacterium ulceribovis TaxID=487732 RepID=UPI00036E6B63|nr:hypothetical protein [Corynebacterium ulceribovis]